MKATRDVQTRVKHEILASYLGKWAGIILNGLAGPALSLKAKGRDFQAGLVYVDGFAYRGRYDGDASEIVTATAPLVPVWGSPIIGAQSLDSAGQYADQRGFHVDTMSVLVEEHFRYFADLQSNLGLAGFGSRVAVNPSTLRIADGEIAVVKGEFQAHLARIVALTQRPHTWSFYLLDPFGPKGIPYDLVRRVTAQATADVMINFPYQDLHKKAGILFRPSAGSRSPSEEALLANYDALFGTRVWREIAERAVAGAPADEWGERVEEALSDFYLDRLRDADPTLAVKRIRIQFPDRDRTMYYLYLTTHDATGALVMNEVLWDANLNQRGLKWRRSQAVWVKKSHNAGQSTMFDPEFGLESTAPIAQECRDVDVPRLADHIYGVFRGRTTTRLDVYRHLADETDVFAKDVDQALRRLKRVGRIQFDKLNHRELLGF